MLSSCVHAVCLSFALFFDACGRVVGRCPLPVRCNLPVLLNLLFHFCLAVKCLAQQLSEESLLMYCVAGVYNMMQLSSTEGTADEAGGCCMCQY